MTKKLVALALLVAASGIAHGQAPEGNASGNFSVALGRFSYASGYAGIAIGGLSRASGESSVAIGGKSKASE